LNDSYTEDEKEERMRNRKNKNQELLTGKFIEMKMVSDFKKKDSKNLSEDECRSSHLSSSDLHLYSRKSRSDDRAAKKQKKETNRFGNKHFKLEENEDEIKGRKSIVGSEESKRRYK
jgi:hypothetical protein